MWPDEQCTRVYREMDVLYQKNGKHFLVTSLRWTAKMYEDRQDCERKKECQDVINALFYAIEKAEKFETLSASN